MQHTFGGIEAELQFQGEIRADIHTLAGASRLDNIRQAAYRCTGAHASTDVCELLAFYHVALLQQNNCTMTLQYWNVTQCITYCIGFTPSLEW